MTFMAGARPLSVSLLLWADDFAFCLWFGLHST